jgi:K+-transporting ATPase ATPase C chain
MLAHIRANLWLLVLTIVLCSVLYPLVLWAVGQSLFPHQAEGSLLDRKGQPVAGDGQAVGSHLIAQPFADDRYFQPRPSAVSYNAAASGASNWAASNYRLRERVARQLGPIVKYRSGPRAGKLVGPDIESWFQKDHFGGKPGIVGQWAEAHPAVAQDWIRADKLNTEFAAAWVARRVANLPHDKPEDLAVPFFTSYSRAHPGTFPSAVEHNAADGKTEKRIEPVKEGTDIRGIFFDMWRQEHADADLEDVPADMVMASGSGLDPHITLKNALYQLDRVAGKWATITKRDEAQARKEIEELLGKRAEAPLGGLVGVDLVNVLEINLALKNHFVGHNRTFR